MKNQVYKNTLFFFLLTLLNFQLFAQKSESNGWYVKDYTEEIAKSYFTYNNDYLDIVEGIWQSSDGFIYSIEKDVENNSRVQNKYRVIVLSSSNNGWKQSEIKAFITRGSTEGVYSMKYYTKNSNGTGLEAQNIFLLVEDPLVLSFSRLDDNVKVILVKLFPKEKEANSSTTFQSHYDFEPKLWSGSGVAIGNKYIATNYHVVEDAKSLVIQIPSINKTVEYKTEIVATDTYNDLAILKVVDSKFKGFGTIPYGSKLTTSELGENVFVLGYPLIQTMGEDVKLTTGVISSKTGFKGDVSQYQISAPVQSGNSGGPLFDNKGNLIGIINSKHQGAENVGYAIKLNYLNSLAEASSENISFPKNNTIASLSLADKVKYITKFVVLIKASSSESNTPQYGNRGYSQNTNVSSSNKSEAQRLYESSISKIKLTPPDIKGSYSDICRSVDFYPTVQANLMKAYLAGVYIYDWDGAMKASKYCIDNGDDRYRIIYANSLMHFEKYDDAIKQYSILISNDRRNVLALYNRGLCYDRTNQEEKALVDYQEAIKFDGIVEFYDYGTIYNNIAYHYIQKNMLDEAVEPMKKALQNNHTIWYIWDSDGELKYKQGKYNECIRSMTNAIAIAKANHKENICKNSYYYRGLAYRALRQFADAYKDLEKASELGNEEANEALKQFNISKIDFSQTSYFSRTVTSPSVKKNKSESTKILGIELTSDYTAVYCSYTNKNYPVGGWYNIDSDAYLRDKSTGKKYKCIATENCNFSPSQTSIELNETKRFVLYFEALPESTNEIDFVEGDKSSWQFYGISLKE